MIDRILPFMRCPRCANTRLQGEGCSVSCPTCNAHYPIEDGILDMMPDEASEVITPFQRVMQAPFVVGIYERIWRRVGYFLASSRSFDDEIASVLRLQADRDEARLLDLACGTGVFTRPLAHGMRGVVVGLDLSRPMLRHARRLAAQEDLRNIVLIRGTAFKIPFIAESFTNVNCCGALHLFDQPELALNEIARVLHRSGRLSVQTSIRPRRSGGFAFVLERFVRFGFFAEDELREKMRRHGFKVVESERHRISYTLLARHISCPH
jgi:SAM-dependent methyltransferase/uncharacterized protein YbaR (Trm112 family)